MENKNMNFQGIAFAALLLMISGCGITITKNYYYGDSSQAVKKPATEETKVKFQSQYTDTNRK